MKIEDIFRDYFSVIAAGPGGIERLRELILEQSADLTPKIGSPTIKRVPLGECGEWLGGLTPSKQQAEYWDDESIPWFSPKDMKRAELDDAQDHITQRALAETSLNLLPPGSVLFVVRGMILAHTFPVAVTTRPATFNQDMRAIIPKPEIYDRYLATVLRGSERRILELVKTSTHGTKKLDSPDLKQWIIPVPPLAEQHRIVEKVDRLMIRCDELERRQQAERKERRRLRTASLAALEDAATAEEAERAWAHVAREFARLVDTLEDVAELRKIILKAAVKGQLTQRCETDGTADDLIQRIIFEKENGNKRTTKECRSCGTTRTSETIPASWAIARFGEISICRDEERIPVSKEDRNTREKIYDYYGASGVIDKIDDYLFDKPLLLIGEDGANLINRSTPIAYIAQGKYWVNNHAHVVDGLSLTMLQYLALYFNSIDLKPYVTGTAQPKLNQTKLNSIPVNVPPLAEQHRIVERVSQLMVVFDTLEAGIRARDAALEAFAGAACRAVLDEPAPVTAPAPAAVRATRQ